MTHFLRVDTTGHDCEGCGVNTHSREGIAEYYMVTSLVWNLAGARSGMLCIGCLEERLGRKLNCRDFLECPVNRSDFRARSLRLRDRLRRDPD